MSRAGVLTALALLLVLALLGLGAGLPKRSFERALSRIEGALSSIEEIQTAEDLEEAQDLAADAEGDLRDAISILDDIEIPNWLWLPKQGALYWHGPILDKQTEQPIEAEVFVNGHVIANQATEVQFLMWVSRPGENDPFRSVEIYPPSASTAEPLPSLLLSTSLALPTRPARLFSFKR